MIFILEGLWGVERSSHRLFNRSVLCFPGGSGSKASACNAEDLGSIPGSGKFLKKEVVTHSSILAWRIPWTEDPGRLQSTRGRKESDMTERLHFTLRVELKCDSQLEVFLNHVHLWRIHVSVWQNEYNIVK